MSTRPPSLIFRGASNSNLRNKYVSGSGVGARSISVRKALSKRAVTTTTTTTTTTSDPLIPIVITASNNGLNLVVGASGELIISVANGTYNTTTFLLALNTDISSKIGGEGIPPVPITVTYNTSTNKFTFVQSRNGEGQFSGGIRITGGTMKSILGFNNVPAGGTFPDSPAESFESQIAVVYNP